MLLTVVEYRLDAMGLTIACCASAAIAFALLRRHCPTQKISWHTWGLIGLLLGLAAISAEWTGKRERTRLRKMVEGFAPTYAMELSRAGHAQLSLDAPADDPLFLSLIDRQIRWLALNPAVADIYTFRRNDQQQFVMAVDSETDYDRNGRIEGEREARTTLGELYEDETDALTSAFTGQQEFEDQPFTDRWGTWVSAYAPMFDANGNVEAVLGVDYAAEDWVRSITWARGAALGVFALLIVLLVAGTVVIKLQQAELEERKQNEQRLRQREQVLEQMTAELQESNRRLDDARQLAETAAKTKTAFLANMSHEMRTPLTGILGFSDLLQQNADDGDERTRQEWLQTISSNGQQLLHVVSEILELTNIESGKLQVSTNECSPIQLLTEVLEKCRSAADDKELQISLETADLPAIVRTDGARLKQMLFNLLDNAIKFTSAGSVRVSATRGSSLAETDRVELIFEVHDTGIGIAHEMLEQIFEPFVQADDSVTRKYGGTGLGLAISQRIAQALGGDIRVTSQLGIGSTFTATIAVEVLAESVISSCPATPCPSSSVRFDGVRILVVDDGPTNRRLVSLCLRRAGAEVALAENGQQALELVASRHFDIILMDLEMPVVDGLAATRALRTSGYSLPIIALTAYSLEEDRQRALAAGCDAFLTKPIAESELLAFLETRLGAMHSSPS